MDSYPNKKIDRCLALLMKILAIVVIVPLSIFIAMFHLYDLFINCPVFEVPFISLTVIFLMLRACWIAINMKNSKTVVILIYVVLSLPGIYSVIGTVDYLRQGFSILINSENVFKQSCRILFICILSLMPVISCCLRSHFRKQ